jgi:hypothetical protein
MAVVCPSCGRGVAAPGFCKSCGQFVDVPAPAPAIAPRGALAGALSVATVTQALTYWPAQAHTPAPQLELLEPATLPYKWGAFQGGFWMVIGIIGALVSLALISSSIPAAIAAVGGSAALVAMGYGVIRKRRIAVGAMLVLQGLIQLAYIVTNPINLVNLLIFIPHVYYFIKRSDEFE